MIQVYLKASETVDTCFADLKFSSGRKRAKWGKMSYMAHVDDGIF